MKTCTIQGCERKHQAKGYCGSHYNQILKPNRHRKEAVACDWCGTTCYKEPSRHNKYQHVYCTLQCRDTHRTALSRLQAGPPLNFLGYWFNCEHCGSEFHTKAINGKYCSTLLIPRPRQSTSEDPNRGRMVGLQQEMHGVRASIQAQEAKPAAL